MEYKDYYKTLDVDKHAGSEELSRAYRKLARRYHPDVNPGDKVAEERYQEINEANTVLAHPDARAKYDRFAAKWEFHHASEEADEVFDWKEWLFIPGIDGQEPELPAALDDLKSKSSHDGFSDFYYGLFEAVVTDQPEPETPQVGEDITQQLEITLQEAFTGTKRILRVGNRKIEVRIPRGARSGTKVRVRGEGAEGAGGAPSGDLYLEIMVAPDPNFERIGDDIHLELPVNVYSAVLGGEAIVSTLKGKIKLRIPPETQSGKVFRIKGQGMPSLKNPEERGDLYAKVMITVPENLTEEEIELFEELADIRGL
ncbi:MAG: DnaJ domain-containing protein [Anaerolineae bacterium]|nr:DnaJ domain-containing protein [Anaerolineae bacterium]